MFWKVSLFLYSLLFVAAAMWIKMIPQFVELEKSTNLLGSSDATSLLQGAEGMIHTSELLEFTQDYGAHYGGVWEQIDAVSTSFHMYFVICGGIGVLLVIRLFEYFHFQKKLSVVTETFIEASGEIAHLFLVLFFTTLGLGFAMFLVLGQQIHAFSSYQLAVANSWRMVFNTWKVKPAQLDHVSAEVRVTAEILVISFRLFVILLLLKMLFAIIFAAYKSSAISKAEKAPSVLKDLKNLGWHIYNYLVWRVTDGCYVSPKEIKKALESHNKGPFKDVPTLNEWDLVEHLNKLYPDHSTTQDQERDENTDRDNKFQFELSHALWVINKYGTRQYGTQQYGTFGIEERAERVRAMFKKFDEDNSETIDRKELKKALDQMGYDEEQAGCMLAHHYKWGAYDIDEFCGVITGHRMDGTLGEQ